MPKIYCQSTFVLLLLLVPWSTMALPNLPIGPKQPFRAFGPGALIIAHRGGSLEAPENTLAAIRSSIDADSDWQEVDIRLSSDRIPMVLHDATLERTTGVAGRISQLPASHLRRMKVGSPSQPSNVLTWLAQANLPVPTFPSSYQGETIPTLQQLLAISGSRLMLELKTEDNAAMLLKQTLQVVQQHSAQERVAIASDSFTLLERLQELEPSIAMIGVAETPPAILKLLQLPLAVLAVGKEHFQTAQQTLLEQEKNHVALWVWTIYDIEEAKRLQEQGAHGIITDRPRAVLQALRAME